jgi:hypothetical protein
MVPTPDFVDFTQLFSDETPIPHWFFVSALIARLLYHQNFDPICLVFRRFSGYASLHGPCTTKRSIPTPLYSLRGNTDANDSSTQFPYDATQGVAQDTYLLPQHAPDSSHPLPRNTIASFDNSVRNCTLHLLPISLY